VTTSLPNALVGSTYSQNIVGTGGLSPYSFFTYPPTLPPGLTLSSAGNLSGIVGGPPGSFTFTVTLVDSRDTSVNQQFTIVTADPLGITSPKPGSLSPTQVGLSYSQTFTGTGGTVPYTFSSPNPPPGLTMSSAGSLSGTPTTAGTYNFTVTLTDA